jgi:RNase adaptor protein for sRNA GlmZ degradation
MLTVRIYSFSYIHGCIPEDTSGHGGGFIFDCRYINNPAWVEEYRSFSGKDTSVIKYLDEDELMKRFLKNMLDMVGDAVTVYQQRGFENLLVGFGCTGGQHRSVYCAEKLKHYLENNFADIKIEVMHNMEEKWKKN